MPDPTSDRFVVQDVMFRYAAGVDTRNRELYSSAFTEDVVCSGYADGEVFHGRDAWVTWVWKALERFGPTQHLMANQVVELRGDEATMRTYVQATHILTIDAKTTLTLWATYHDELIRDGALWRIRNHRLAPAATQTLTSA